MRSAHHGHHHVALTGQVYRFVDSGLLRHRKGPRVQLRIGPGGIYQLTTLYVVHLGPVSHQGLDAVQRAHHVDVFRPVVVTGIFDGRRIRPHHGNAFEVLQLKRQNAGIFQQDRTLAGGLQGNGLVFGLFHFLIGPLEVPLIRIVEQPQEEFGA